MTRLLAADFRRLWRSRLLWVMAVFMVLLGIYMGRESVLLIHAWGREEELPPMEKNFFVGVLALSVLSAVFSALFVGAEYGSGAMRNKLTAGHRRCDICFSGQVACTVATLLFGGCYTVGYLAFAIPQVGGFAGGFWQGLLQLTLFLTAALALASLFVCIATTVSNRAYSAVICLLAAVALVGIGFLIANVLEELPTYTRYSVDQKGEMFSYEVPNPSYVGGFARKLLLFLRQVNPCGQALYRITGGKDGAGLTVGLNLGMTALFSCVGALLFRKKDLK